MFEEELTADNEALDELREQSTVDIQDSKALFNAIDKKVGICWWNVKLNLKVLKKIPHI